MDSVIRFIEETAPAWVFWLAGALVCWRAAVLLISLTGAGKPIWAITRISLPLHRPAPRRPVYWSLRAFFHLGLLITPLLLAQHLMLWEEAGLDLDLSGLPKTWAVGLSLALLAGLVFFLIRRLSGPRPSRSGPGDYALLAMTALPLVSGLLSANGPWPWLPGIIRDNLFTLHLFFGELFILGLGFLIFRTRLDKARCTGCAACALNCPAAALAVADKGLVRRLFYTQARCLGCAACAALCPEEALELGHTFALPPWPGQKAAQVIRRATLEACPKCGRPLAPADQLVALSGRAAAGDDLGICPECRQEQAAEEWRGQVFGSMPLSPLVDDREKTRVGSHG